jgi:hypothetical protein
MSGPGPRSSAHMNAAIAITVYGFAAIFLMIGFFVGYGFARFG